MNVCHFGNYEMPDYQRNLVYAKALEIREEYPKKAASKLLNILLKSEKDVETGNVALMQDTIEELSKFLLMRNTKN